MTTLLPSIPPTPTPASTDPDNNDGRDDATYQRSIVNLTVGGRQLCILFVLGIGVVAFIFSSLFHGALFNSLPEAREYVNPWITVFGLCLFVWGLEIIVTMTWWNLWISVKENHAWIVINPFGTTASKKLKFGTGFYFIPPWWTARPENLVNLEKVTRSLPNVTYSAKDSIGAAFVNGSFIYRVMFSRAERYIGLDHSSLETGLNNSIIQRIGPEVRKWDRHRLGGDTTEITEAISGRFVGTNNPTEILYCIDILDVTISSITLDPKTREALDREMDAKARALATPDLLAPIKDKDGNIIKDEVERFDAMVAAGLDPKREKKDYKVTGEGGMASLLAMAEQVAKILGKK